jgi:hypothetical protein
MRVLEHETQDGTDIVVVLDQQDGDPPVQLSPTVPGRLAGR